MGERIYRGLGCKWELDVGGRKRGLPGLVEADGKEKMVCGYREEGGKWEVSAGGKPLPPLPDPASLPDLTPSHLPSTTPCRPPPHHHHHKRRHGRRRTCGMSLSLFTVPG